MEEYEIEAELIGTRKATIKANNLTHARSKFDNEEWESVKDVYQVDHILGVKKVGR